MANISDHASRQRYWQQQVKAWHSSGLSQRAFCRNNDLNYARFGYWVRKLGKGSEPMGSKPSHSGFVPVTLKSSSVIGGLHLVLPSGLEVHGINEGNVSLVRQLLGTLS